VYEHLEAQNYTREEAVQGALEYLQTLSAGDDELALYVKNWKEIINQQGISRETAREIFEAVKDYGDQITGAEENLAKLKEQSLEAAHAWHDAMFPTDSDIE